MKRFGCQKQACTWFTVTEKPHKFSFFTCPHKFQVCETWFWTFSCKYHVNSYVLIYGIKCWSTCGDVDDHTWTTYHRVLHVGLIPCEFQDGKCVPKPHISQVIMFFAHMKPMWFSVRDCGSGFGVNNKSLLKPTSALHSAGHRRKYNIGSHCFVTRKQSVMH